jgi:hypothetical protein
LTGFGTQSWRPLLCTQRALFRQATRSFKWRYDLARLVGPNRVSSNKFAEIQEKEADMSIRISPRWRRLAIAENRKPLT